MIRIKLFSIFFLTYTFLIMHQGLVLGNNLFLPSVNNTNQLNVQPISGKWHFYWKQLVDPAFTGTDTIGAIKARVPGYWTEYSGNNKPISNFGFGSYTLTVILKPGYRQPVGIFIPAVDVAYCFYINGEKIAQCGQVGKSKEQEIPEYSPEIVNYQPKSDTLNFVFHVSNFHHRRGGIWKQLIIGPYEKVVLTEKKDELLDLISLGILFSFGVFFLLFYYYYRSNKSILFISLSFLFIFLRGICSNFYPIRFISNISWTWMIRLEYISDFGALIAAIWGFFFPYHISWIKRALHILSVGLIPVFAGILLLPVSIFSYSLFIFYFYMIIGFVFYMIQSNNIIKSGEKIPIVYVIGFAILILAVCNDILVANSIDLVFNFYIVPKIFLIFVLILSIEFFRKYVETYNNEKKLSKELARINLSLEKIVAERTSQLVEKNKIIEHQNETLQKDIFLKNKILSIIGHDIRGPLSSIIMGLDIIIDRDLSEELKDEFINKIYYSANSVTLLVENLLSWGLSQNNQLIINPGLNDLSPIIEITITHFKAYAEFKNLNIEQDIPEKAIGWFDENSIAIIIRNLLSNAIKFTPTKGTVSIKAEVKPNQLIVEIKDSGIGMSAETIEKLKQGNDILSQAGTNNEKGTGLGLFLCRELIKINNSELVIKSELGKGSRFTFSLLREKPS